jgi:murein L,D-transpeptidase YcbB/YkuD
MGGVVEGLRSSVSWILIAAIASSAGSAGARASTSARADLPIASPVSNYRLWAVSPPFFVSRLNFRVLADLAGVDLRPLGSTKRTGPPHVSMAESAKSITSIKAMPAAVDAPEALLNAPLPPDVQPLPPSGANIPVQISSPPASGAPSASEGPVTEAVASAEPAAPIAPHIADSPNETNRAPASFVAPEPAAAAPANLEAPGTVPPTAEVPSALDAALASLVAQTASVNPLGAGDWRAARDAIRAFYAERLFAPVWLDAQGLTPAGRAVLARLGRAGEDGLDLGAFTLPDLTSVESRPERLAQIETTISAAMVAYAMQASGARIAPAKLSKFVTANPVVVDPAKVLSETSSAAEPGDVLAAYNPSQRGYRDLRDELARLRGSAPVARSRAPAGPTLRIGMADPRVPLIRARFGLGAQADPSGARIYDARVATAVAAFQKSKGLAADGALTTATSEALFGDPNFRRETAIIANMEMWRWLPRDMGQDRIEINVADYKLHVMSGDDETHSARVIVGKPDTPTPIFSNEVKYILVNPIWRVPDSIIKKEMLPRLASDPNYLARRGYQVSYVGGRLVVNQPPGEGNALGRILFMFPNEHSVYLHDTPTRGLFATTRRDYSHGCVRVEEPLRLAELLMGGPARGWSAGKIQSLLGSSEKAIFLPHPLPIHIEYFTEFVDADGAAQEREDVYGLTADVAEALSRLRQY